MSVAAALLSTLSVAGCATTSQPGGPGLGAWLFGSLALFLVGAAGLWVGGLRQAARHGKTLQAEQRRGAMWQRLADGAGWQTDAAHRLLSLDVTLLPAPPRPAESAWRLRPLWEVFEDEPDATTPGLAALLSARGAISARPVRQARPHRMERTERHESAAAALELTALPMFDEAGAFSGYLGTVRAARRAAAAEIQADDTAALSYTVSHDLRAPIRVVEGFTRILKEDYGQHLDRVGNDHLERVLGAAARMNQMIDALLTQARLSTQPLVRQPVNLSQMAAYVAEDLQRAAPEREMQFDIEPEMQAHGDPTLLRLVVENLLGNACKYTQRCRQAEISFHAEARIGSRSFVVSDNGAGFDMRSVDRLFGLFQRLHSASDYPGTGVGLASVRRIVRRHGGEIWAEAEPGRGAKFHFTLSA